MATSFGLKKKKTLAYWDLKHTNEDPNILLHSRPAASASTGSWLEMQDVSPHHQTCWIRIWILLVSAWVTPMHNDIWEELFAVKHFNYI